MTDIRWNLLQPVDVGQRFNEGFQFAQQNALRAQERAYQQEERGRASQLRNALSGAYDATSGRIDPARARQAYASVGDIPGAMQFDATQAQTQQRLTDAQKDQILIGGSLLNGVTDEAGFQAARATYAQMNLPMEGVPEHFDANYVSRVTQAAQALQQGGRAATPPAMQQNYEFLQRTSPQLAEQYLRRQTEQSPIVANNGDGTFTLIPRSQGVPQQPGQPGQPAQPAAPPPPRQGEVRNGRPYFGGDPASPSSWGPRQGGPTQSGSGTFR